MLKLIGQHSPNLLAFLYGLHLRLSKPQWQHVLRLADALVVSEARHKTLAGLYRLIVEAPDPSNGADTLRICSGPQSSARGPTNMRKMGPHCLQIARAAGPHYMPMSPHSVQPAHKQLRGPTFPAHAPTSPAQDGRVQF